MASSKTNRALILKLKQIKDECSYSINDIVNLVEQNGDFISRSSVQRVFADGSEEISFKYEETIRPIANALLDIDNIEENDDSNTQSMKALLQYKDELIEELKSEIERIHAENNQEILKLHERMDSERVSWAKSIDFLKSQISLKDERIDYFMEVAKHKESRNDEMFHAIMTCPCRKKEERA